MAQQEIRYNRQTARPDDYSVKDGDLAISLNLISEDGALHPLIEPQTLFTLPSGCRVMFVHATATYKHYIVSDSSGQLYWIDSTNAHDTVSLPNNHQIGTISGAKSVTAVGNTLVVLTDTAMHYALWKNNNYTYLGTHLPELGISFGLQGKAKKTELFAVKIKDGLVSSESPITYSEAKTIDPFIFEEQRQSFPIADSGIKYVTDTVLAKVNKFINDESIEAGKFMFPFFVCYAYRLYDGSLTMQSSPVLMLTCTDITPKVYVPSFSSETQGGVAIAKNANACVSAMVYDLDFACLDQTELTNLNDWSDIINTVDIFVSPPIFTYDETGKVQGWQEINTLTDGDTIACINEADDVYVDLPLSSYGEYCKWPCGSLLRGHYGNERQFLLPRHSQEDVNNATCDCNEFRLLKSYEVSQLSTTRTKINLPIKYLASIHSRELMSNDYDSHDYLAPRVVFMDNMRLMLSDITKTISTPHSQQCYFPHNTANYIRVTGGWNNPSYSNCTIRVVTKKDTRTILLNGVNAEIALNGLLEWFYYPDPDAYLLYITFGSGASDRLLPLKRHDFMNGTYFHSSFSNQQAIFPLNYSSDRTVRLPNKLYVSSVGNPFYFPVSGISTVGTGTIQALATVNEPVSQGQFGHSDIYIFTTDGLWVAKIMADGKLESINPVSQDVCTNPAAVVQLAKTVLFPTQRGIMAVAGSRIEPLTDTIDTDNPFNLAALPHLTDPNVLPAALGTPALPAFQQFINGCKMLFDYQHQRVVVFNPAVDDNDQRLYPYAYVYSLRSKQWGMMQSDLTDTFNAYPDAMAMSGNTVVTLNTDTTFGNQLFVTRPLKLGLPDVLKTIRAIIQRGMFSRGHVKCILYGSRDLVHWYVVGSSMSEAIRRMSGSGYKYFRVAVLSTLAASETLTGATVEAVPRHTNLLI